MREIGKTNDAGLGRESLLGAITRRRLERKRAEALVLAKKALAFLAQKGFDAVVFGSVLREDKFGDDSDIDIAIMNAKDDASFPPFSEVAEHLGTDRFDLIYHHQALPHIKQEIEAHGKRIGDLH